MRLRIKNLAIVSFTICALFLLASCAENIKARQVETPQREELLWPETVEQIAADVEEYQIAIDEGDDFMFYGARDGKAYFTLHKDLGQTNTAKEVEIGYFEKGNASPTILYKYQSDTNRYLINELTITEDALVYLKKAEKTEKTVLHTFGQKEEISKTLDTDAVTAMADLEDYLFWEELPAKDKWYDGTMYLASKDGKKLIYFSPESEKVKCIVAANTIYIGVEADDSYTIYSWEKDKNTVVELYQIQNLEYPSLLPYNNEDGRMYLQSFEGNMHKLYVIDRE